MSQVSVGCSLIVSTRSCVCVWVVDCLGPGLLSPRYICLPSGLREVLFALEFHVVVVFFFSYISLRVILLVVFFFSCICLEVTLLVLLKYFCRNVKLNFVRRRNLCMWEKWNSNFEHFPLSDSLHGCNQWRIQDFPRAGAPTPQSGDYFFNFLPKTAWKWKNLDPRWGGGAFLAPLGSANGNNNGNALKLVLLIFFQTGTTNYFDGFC